jgi:hypothetical protein
MLFMPAAAAPMEGLSLPAVLVVVEQAAVVMAEVQVTMQQGREQRPEVVPAALAEQREELVILGMQLAAAAALAMQLTTQTEMAVPAQSGGFYSPITLHR